MVIPRTKQSKLTLRWRLFLKPTWLFLLVIFYPSQTPAGETASLVNWQAWNEDSIALARSENKIILLNLEAVWCHWCHVMDEQTYNNPNVAKIINEHYVPIKVDHDARPDLANRYRDYGWPATIFIDMDQGDLVKRAGFIKPENFIRLLNALLADPTPERAALLVTPEEFAISPALPKSVHTELVRRHKALYDPELGGLRSNQKTLDRDHVEYALKHANTDEFEREVAETTIKASFALQDPEWGGIYQYSTFGDWQHPHYEKIMASQAGFMRIYALAYQRFGDPIYLKQAEKIASYLARFLMSPEGTYYTSQDADLVQGVKGTEYFALSDKERLELGIPKIDKNVYARENGWAIEALAMLYEASGKREYLNTAERAALAINASHRLVDHNYVHGTDDSSTGYFSDSLHMAAALLQLYKVTGDKNWLVQAENTARIIARKFRASSAGYLTGSPLPDSPVQPTRHLEENIKATRFFNLLAQYTGDEYFNHAAEHAMRYLATEKVAFSRIEDSGILIAATEMAQSAVHFTVVGMRQDPMAQALHRVAMDQPGWYKRLEWWDKTEGPLRNADVTYPSYERAAGFVCVDRLCSAPAFSPEQYAAMIKRLVSHNNGL